MHEHTSSSVPAPVAQVLAERLAAGLPSNACAPRNAVVDGARERDDKGVEVRLAAEEVWTVQHAGTASWRFAHDLPTTPHALLYVRDALGLDELASFEVPHLIDAVPDRRALLSESERHDAAGAWPSWWARALGVDAEDNLVRDPTDASWRAQVFERRQQLADPPAWSSLGAHPGLQRAAQLLHDEASLWANDARRPYLPSRRRELFPWHLIRDAAEETATRFGVPPGVVNGSALILLVEGVWWQQLPSGAVLCSVAAAMDPATATSILRRVFAFSLS